MNAYGRRDAAPRLNAPCASEALSTARGCAAGLCG